MSATIIPYEDAVQAAERDRKCYQLRLAGVDSRRIAVELNLSLEQVEGALVRMTNTAPPSLRQRTMQMELDRLDALQKAHYANAVQGGVGATAVTLKIMEHRDRLLGLYAPTRSDDPLAGLTAGDESSTAALLRELDRIADERKAVGGPTIEGEVLPSA